MEFNDVNQWHRVTDRGAYERAGLPMIEIRCCSASGGSMYIDTQFRAHRDRFAGFPRLYYQFPYGDWSPERQADYLADALGSMDGTEMAMLDIEAGSGIGNPVDFTNRWLARFESRMPGNRAWVYLPKALASSGMYSAIGDRIVKCPRYSGGAGKGAQPNWGRWDVWQFSDRAPMPGSPDGPGDRNYSALSMEQIFSRCKTGASSRSNAQQKLLLL